MKWVTDAVTTEKNENERRRASWLSLSGQHDIWMGRRFQGYSEIRLDDPSETSSLDTHWFTTILASKGNINNHWERSDSELKTQVHTILKVKVLSKNSILTKPQHFHKFFPQIFLTIFLVKSKLSTAKMSKTTTFSRAFHPKKSTIFSRNQS